MRGWGPGAEVANPQAVTTLVNRDQTVLEVALENQAVELKEVELTLERLERRLQPVLTPGGEASAPNDPRVPGERSRSFVVHSIEALTNQMVALRSRLETLLSTLEV